MAPEKLSWKHLYSEVVTSGLCTGCAGCVIACPHDVLGYRDDQGVYKPFQLEEGWGPENCSHGEKSCTSCTRACPRFRAWEPEIDEFMFGRTRTNDEPSGIYKDIVLARATDPILAEVGQDGGLVSALLVYALEHDMIDAALVSYLEGDGTTWKAIPGVARTRDEIIASAGSRYTYSANTLAYTDAIEGGAERIALVGMSCQSSIAPVMKQRKAGKVARRLALNIGLLCSKTFDDAIFEELFEAKYGLKKADMKKMNIKGVFQIWMNNGDYHEIPLKECHAWTREGCKMCPDFAAEHADISTGGIGAFNDWTLTIVRTDVGRELMDGLVRDGWIETRPGDDDPGAIALMHKLSAKSRKRWPEFAIEAPRLLPTPAGLVALSPRRHIRVPVLGKAAPPIGSEFVNLEAASGIVLLLAAAAALIWANTDAAGYTSWWHRELTIGPGDLAITESLVHWVNDALMTVFFFVVGLEIKRELVTGELRDRQRVALPAVAALGGMVVPALLFVAINLGGDGLDGWAIPMATDIAFAVGVLALLGPRVPSSLKIFLLTLAIVDDIGAILVIALFYSRGLDGWWLLGALATVLVVLAFSRLGVHHPLAYVLPGIVLWWCLHEAGVEPTLAGVVLGLMTPARPRGGVAVLERLEGSLHPISSFVIVPIFALANAGVALGGDAIEHALSSRVTIGIVVGLVVGKFVGILGASMIALRSGIGTLPDGVHARHVAGVAVLSGIGFTVSLFISDLAFRGTTIDDAKIGVLAASALAAVLGMVVLRVLLRGPVVKTEEAA